MKQSRRTLLKSGAALGASAAWQQLSKAQESIEVSKPKPIDPVRVGFVGIGVKGSAHLGNLLNMDGVEVRAVCDIIEAQCEEAQRQAEHLGKPTPRAYTRGERDFERLCETEELDLVYTATPWRWHTPVCLAAMRNGKHAATEIPAAITLEECWELVETAEKTNRYCAMMENVNYFRPELTILRMIREGLLGELVHAEAGYMHDTRWLKIKDTGDGLWLGNHHAERNGNLYPTHGLGPVAWYMNINRGDRFDYLVSMSSNARGMDLYAKEHLPEGHPKRERHYINGDVNTSLIKTVNGLSIILKHDTDLPRPYSRDNIVQGTQGMVRGFPRFEVCIEGKDHRHQWKPGDSFYEKYDHPLWNEVETRSASLPNAIGPLVKGAVWRYNPATELRNGDFLEDFRLIQALRTGVAPDFDVYDAASWSAVSALSERSVANRSQLQEFPDFTKGNWQHRPPLKILGV